MNVNTWKIATINVQGINNPKKFDDVIQWIEHHDLDITILTETKLDPIFPIYNLDLKKNQNLNKNHKKYKSSWTIDSTHPQGSGIGIITKKTTVGNHHFSTKALDGRILQMNFKFKGKITLTITGIYGPASKRDHTTKRNITTFLEKHIRTNDNQFNIMAGDFNEDPEKHKTCLILDSATNLNLYNLNLLQETAIDTWTNPMGTSSVLDHILVSDSLAPFALQLDTKSTKEFFQTDHKAVMLEAHKHPDHKGAIKFSPKKQKNQQEVQRRNNQHLL